MAELICPEFDQYADAIRGVQGRYVTTGAPVRDWRLGTLDLGDVVVMSAADGASNLYHGACVASHFSLFIPICRPGAIALDGVPLGPDSMAWLTPDRQFHFRSHRPSRWLALNLSSQRIAARLVADEQPQPGVPIHARATRVDAAASRILLEMIRRAFTVQADDPLALAHPSSRLMLCEQLLELALLLLPDRPLRARSGRGRPPADRRAILQRVLGFMDAHLEQPLYVDDLCRAGQVSRQTLYLIFSEQFGMAPHAYLAIRRLHAIRAALQDAGDGQTVSSICSRYGVWDFGRFAGQFRQMFGHLPSQVLRRH